MHLPVGDVFQVMPYTKSPIFRKPEPTNKRRLRQLFKVIFPLGESPRLPGDQQIPKLLLTVWGGGGAEFALYPYGGKHFSGGHRSGGTSEIKLNWVEQTTQKQVVSNGTSLTVIPAVKF